MKRGHRWDTPAPPTLVGGNVRSSAVQCSRCGIVRERPVSSTGHSRKPARYWRDGRIVAAEKSARIPYVPVGTPSCAEAA